MYILRWCFAMLPIESQICSIIGSWYGMLYCGTEGFHWPQHMQPLHWLSEAYPITKAGSCHGDSAHTLPMGCATPHPKGILIITNHWLRCMIEAGGWIRSHVNDRLTAQWPEEAEIGGEWRGCWCVSAHWSLYIRHIWSHFEEVKGTISVTW